MLNMHHELAIGAIENIARDLEARGEGGMAARYLMSKPLLEVEGNVDTVLSLMYSGPFMPGSLIAPTYGRQLTAHNFKRLSGHEMPDSVLGWTLEAARHRRAGLRCNGAVKLVMAQMVAFDRAASEARGVSEEGWRGQLDHTLAMLRQSAVNGFRLRLVPSTEDEKDNTEFFYSAQDSDMRWRMFAETDLSVRADNPEISLDRWRHLAATAMSRAESIAYLDNLRSSGLKE